MSEELPEIIDAVAQACGLEVALAFATAFGGRELYIPQPRNMVADHPIAQAVGLEAATKIAHALGHHRLLVPFGPASSMDVRNKLFRKLFDQNISNAKIAKALGIHVRAVERRIQRLKQRLP